MPNALTNVWHRHYLIRRYVYGPCLKLGCGALHRARRLVPDFLLALDRPIFIVGVSRSGTTVFVDLFKRHRDLCNWSEAAQILEPDFYNPAVDHRKNEDHATDEDAFRLRLMFGAKTRLWRRGRFVNKHPENSVRIKYLKAIFPDAIFVHMIREGHATIHSNFSRTHLDSFRTDWPFGQFPKPVDWRAHLERPLLEQFAHQWTSLVEHIRRTAADSLGPGEYLEIRYEDFCARPRSVLAEVDRSCGLSAGHRDDSGIPAELPNHNEKWRALAPEMWRPIEPLIGPLNRALGYGIN